MIGWSPEASQEDWDGDWASQVPGAAVSPSGDFTATLHDRRAPFTVRWRCGHSHADAGLAELCALDARRELDRGDLLAVHHGSRLQAAEAAAGRPAVRLAADPGVTVTVAVPPGGTVSARPAAGGNLEVVISGPEG